MFQTRSHTCGLDDEFDIEECNTFFGSYTVWSQWTKCSASCGGGMKRKTRSHTCGLPDDIQIEVRQSLFLDTGVWVTTKKKNTK